MQTDLQLNKRHLPSVAKKPQSVHSIFELIRLKKAEFSRQLDDIDGLESAFPQINSEKKEDEEEILSTHQIQQKPIEQRATQYNNSYKYKTILDQNMRPERALNQSNKIENSMSISRKQNTNQIKNRNNRTKTEFNPIEPRKLTSNTSAAYVNDLKDEQKQERIEQAKRNFYESVELIPKNMKQRNQDNLTQSLANLQTFNPFFCRNQRIVNICLLKMGRILLRDSPFQLYKAGDQLEHFYIILAGKVKIADGFVKRVCQTGETILQQILFTEKGKRVSLERAKVIGPTYLLEFHLEEFKKLKEQLIRYGLKIAFQEMEAIIKRNFIIKNWMRNKKKVEGRR